ncbi:hypothetical protein HY494_01430 [Candidatus Woesearchaeota archaeon]|nr:hypothetical protein [Candidatus Aenigmarchaeota archaeon]MBI4147293.1 hypothetical protein [Candidatus Woesearchaeota archaeon]
MNNKNIVVSIIGLFVFLIGLNFIFLSFSSLAFSLSHENAIPTAVESILAIIGGFLITMSGVVISPLYESKFKKNKTLSGNGTRISIIIILLIVGIILLWLSSLSSTIVYSP